MTRYPGPTRTDLEPDDDCIHRFLSWWFERCNRGMIELCWRDALTGAWLARRVALEDINAATLFAVDTNVMPGRSLFFRPATVRGDTQNTTDADVIQIPGCWADCDDSASIARVLQAELRPSAQVVTGLMPAPRSQFFWKFSGDPTLVGDHSRTLNRQVQALSGSDPAVTNPSTLMRLPGSIAWPWKPGRPIELTEWLTPEGGGNTWAMDALRAGFPAVEAGVTPAKLNGTATAVHTASELLSPTDALLESARLGQHWHDHVRDAVAKMVAHGFPDWIILNQAEHITLPNYTVQDTRADLAKMIEGARRKGFAPDEDDVVEDASAVEADVMGVPPPEAPAAVRILTEDDLETMPDPVWLIDERLVADSLCVLYGPWGSFKSFIALHIALCLVTGIPFFGQRVVRSDVLYIAGEGASGIKKRLAAWKKHHEIDRVRGFRVVAVAINLLDRAEAERLIAAVLEAQKADGFNPKLVIVDTLHRAMPGGDENTAKEMGIVLANGAHIQRRLGCILMPVHHSGKEFDRGMRGSTGLPGGTDTILRMTRDGTGERGTLLVEKQKDGEDGQEHRVISQVIDLPPSPGSLKPRSSLVLAASEAPSGQHDKSRKRIEPKGDAGIGLRVLADTIVKEGEPLPVTDGFPTTPMRGVTELVWRREFYRRTSDKTAHAKLVAFGRMMSALRDAGLVGFCDSRVWLVHPQDEAR
jgi:hypothetical protein